MLSLTVSSVSVVFIFVVALALILSLFVTVWLHRRKHGTATITTKFVCYSWSILECYCLSFHADSTQAVEHSQNDVCIIIKVYFVYLLSLSYHYHESTQKLNVYINSR